jgi:dihydrofolate reductase
MSQTHPLASDESVRALGALAEIALVVAVADNGVIGRHGALPWHLPDDLKHFKSVTFGKPVLMGRRTFESIGKPLPGRRNLVLSRRTATSAGVEFVSSLEEARAMTAEAAQLCVIGGAALFAMALPLTQFIYLTEVHASPDGDVYFPPLQRSSWRELERSEHPADDRHACAMSFLTLQRLP